MPRKAKIKSVAVAELPNELVPVLHRVQDSFVGCGKIYKAYTGGVGSGKSFCGAYDLITNSEPGSLVAVVAPTYRMLSDSTMRSFVEVANRLGQWNEGKYRKTDNQAVLNNGTEVLFRSGDEPAKLRGPSLRRMWLDEAGLMSEEVFNVCVGRLRFGGQQGTLTATFTPQGKDHWTYRLFADKYNPNVALFRSSTRDNPFLAKEFYENLLLQYGRGDGGLLRAKQELEGEFVQIAGCEWDASCFGDGIWFKDYIEDPIALRYVSLDTSKGIGGKTGDYSCFVKAMWSRNKFWLDVDMDNQRNTSAIAERAIQIQKEFQPDWFGIEAEFGGSVLVDDLMTRAAAQDVAMNLCLIPTHGITKEVRIRRLTRFITCDMFRYRATEITRKAINQLESFPNGEHDDFPDALEMAVRMLVESGVFNQEN